MDRADLAGLDARAGSRQGPEGARAVPSVAPGADRARERARDGQAPAADRPRQGGGAARGQGGLTAGASTPPRLHGNKASYRMKSWRLFFFPAPKAHDVSSAEAQLGSVSLRFDRVP